MNKVYKIYVDREQVGDIIAKNYEEAYLEARRLYPTNYLRIFQDFPYIKHKEKP
jgi:hypothetical protein